MAKLVGFKRFVAKKNGKEYCVANVISEYSGREKANGCIGEKVEEIFLPEELTNLLQPGHVGKDVKMEYELSGNRAYLVNLEIVNK